VNTRLRSQVGAAAVEYSFLVVAIAAAIIVVVFAIGTWTQGSYQSFCDEAPTSESSDC
jgi:Flp pilus assembly pilin Flp